MKTLKTLAVCAVLAISALSMAQGRGGGMRMMGGGGGSQSMLLGREDVQKELKLTDTQKSKLEEMRNAMMEEMRGSFQPGGDREAMMKQVQEMMKKADKEALAVLDDSQKKRLKELWIQRSGNRIVANEDMQKELGLSDEQKSKIKGLQDAQNAANQEIFQKMQNGEIDRTEIRPLMEKNNKALDEELGKVLTADQSAKLKAMGGTPFKFDEDNGGR